MNKVISRPIFIVVNSPLYVLQHLLPIVNSLVLKNDLYILTPHDSRYTIPNGKYRVIYIPLKREPSIIDFISLLNLMYLRFVYNPSISISFTPKAGLINAFSFVFSGITIHYFTGQRWASFTGYKRLFYKNIDKLICLFSRDIFCDSKSQSKFISQELNIKLPEVISSGSLSGVDTKRFVENSNPFNKLLNSNLTIPNSFLRLLKEFSYGDLCLFGYIGRITIDKGISELLEGFRMHCRSSTNSYLILIGPIEDERYNYIKESNLFNIFHIDFNRNIELFLPCFSCLVLPSYREGFGSVILEAASCSKPTIATEIPGPIDFISHNKNGILIRPRSSHSIKTSMDFIHDNPEKVIEMGKAAKKLVSQKYSQELVSEQFARIILNRYAN